MSWARLAYLVTFGALTTTIVCACNPVLISTPEQTVARFVEGYRRGDESLVLSTMYESGGIAPIKSGRDENYSILEKLLVLESADVTSQAGDIHLRIDRQIRDVNGPVEMIAYFRLRKVNGEWKIIGYAAYC